MMKTTPKWAAVFAVIVALSWEDAAAQSAHLLLVAPPVAADPVDSVFALEVADGVRRAVGSSPERRTVSKREMCVVLRAYNYSCDSLIREDEADRLALAFAVDAYITGSIKRDPDILLELRIRSRTRTGYSGSVEVRGRVLEADSIMPAVRAALRKLWAAAARARACYDARDAGLYPEAIAHAIEARAVVPNHAVASLCQASVFELTDQPLDSLIRVYRQALIGDSSLTDAQHRLAILHLQNGDTLSTLSATVLLAKELRREPNNTNLRTQVVWNWISAGEPDSALVAVRTGAAHAEEGLELLRMISRVCLDRELWHCEFEALKRQYQLDPGLAGDTTFYYRIIGAAQNIGDASGILQWTMEAVQHAQQTLREAEDAARRARGAVRSLWMAHAGALGGSGDRDSAVGVYQRLWLEDTTEVRPLLAAAAALADPRVLGDSGVSLDEGALRRADSMLTMVAARREDRAMRQTIAAVYFNSATQLVQTRRAPATASSWLEKTISYDEEGRMHERANSLNGLALFYVVQGFDAAIREQRSCELVDRAEETIARSREATTVGRDAYPAVARQVLEALEAYAAFIPQYREALSCRE
jgi:tetratricopeptide (TPR) repeat protein